ncbi:type II CAAX endopeptidase family protein [Flavobacterium sp.]|uniref:CPBP family intramembrane glutamic endopeptidase n=1 Tax=Flavobacterium sp. TaxID=239 RepID=UPI003266ED7C
MPNNTNSTKNHIVIVGILISILLPFLAILSSYLFKQTGFTGEIKFFISRICIWFSLLLLFLYNYKIEKLPFLLWTEKQYSFSPFVIAVFETFLKLFIAVIIVGSIILLFKIKVESVVLNKALALFKNNYFLLFFTCVTAGITEELFFRGYLLPRLAIVLKNTKLAIVLSSLLFGLMHYGYGTLFQMIGPAVIGLVLAFQYQKYQNIKMVILCHFLWDLLLLSIKTS